MIQVSNPCRNVEFAMLGSFGNRLMALQDPYCSFAHELVPGEDCQ